MKKMYVVPILLTALLLAGASYYKLKVATGTAKSSAGYIMTFSSDCTDLLILSNRNSTNNPIYYKINDGPTTTTTATSYDIVLEQNTQIVLGRNEIGRVPVKTVGVFTAAETPVTRIVGQ